MANGLNDQNLMALLQLKAKQASFCSQVITVMMWAIAQLDLKVTFMAADGNHAWSLQSLLMQVKHPMTNMCAFFQAIDNYSTRNGVVFTMLPSAVAYGCNAVLGIIPFTCWLLEPVYGKQQSHNLDTTFHLGTIQDMAMATWDQAKNCVQQKEGDLLGRALNDLDIYDLQLKQTGKPQTMVVVDTTGTELQASHDTTNTIAPQVAPDNHQNTNITTHNNDSLTNSIQSQATMFTQAIHQMDTLAEWQATFETNTQLALETIMQQLEEINQHNRKWQYTQQYEYCHSDDDHHSRLAADDSMEEDIGEE